MDVYGEDEAPYGAGWLPVLSNTNRQKLGKVFAPAFIEALTAHSVDNKIEKSEINDCIKYGTDQVCHFMERTFQHNFGASEFLEMADQANADIPYITVYKHYLILNDVIDLCYKFADAILNEAQGKPNQAKKPQKTEKKPENKSGCFVTTAVCGSFGKPDNCYELETFRSFRDNWLKKQSDGTALIDEYYDVAPRIVAVIDKLNNEKAIYTNIWETYLRPCLKMIEAKDYQGCKETYVAMVNALKKEYID